MKFKLFQMNLFARVVVLKPVVSFVFLNLFSVERKFNKNSLFLFILRVFVFFSQNPHLAFSV